MSSLAKRLWIYQKERFPLGILTITTAAVLASTFAVLEWTGYYDIRLGCGGPILHAAHTHH
jgi:hypothetical protein